MHTRIVNGLLRHNIHCVSYASDGAAVERNVQRYHLATFGDSRRTYSVSVPGSSLPNINLNIPYDTVTGFYSTIGSDAPHLLKTGRNNQGSGARILTLGNFVTHYQQLYELVHEEGCPLYRRDVINVDRQDDRAAIRLFSSAMIQFVASKRPDYVGLIVYLFVFGELHDAFQNRFISITDRLRMVLRARYFCDHWRSFLRANGHPEAKHYISHEMHDIIQIQTEGLLSLILIYRDHLPAGPQPLFPWLHNTAPNEHTYGVARGLVPDFTLLQFVYMWPKLVRLMGLDFKLHQGASDARKTAGGYQHIYTKPSNSKLMSDMAQLPSDRQIAEVGEAAAEESGSLWSLLQVNVAALARPGVPIPEAYNNPVDDESDDEDDTSMNTSPPC